jgi:hypothetical protein
MGNFNAPESGAQPQLVRDIRMGVRSTAHSPRAAWLLSDPGAIENCASGSSSSHASG